MTTDAKEYEENKARAAELREEIERLEGFDQLTLAQERKLSALRDSYEVTDEMRKEYERAQLVAQAGTRHSGHTPRDLDDDPLGG